MKTSCLFLSALFLVSFSALGEDKYQAPKLKWKPKSTSVHVNVAQEKDFNDFGENRYKVREDVPSQRDVASEKKQQEEKGRNPSSSAEAPPAGSPQLQYWPYK